MTVGKPTIVLPDFMAFILSPNPNLLPNAGSRKPPISCLRQLGTTCQWQPTIHVKGR